MVKCGRDYKVPKKPFRKPCLKCDIMFQPKTRHTRLCDICFYKARKARKFGK